MMNRLEKVMVNLFLFKNKDVNDIHILNERFIEFYYKMNPKYMGKLNISYFWGKVIREWNIRQNDTAKTLGPK